jgi:hypothetical protein
MKNKNLYEELLGRCLAAGYEGVLVGVCDIEALDKDGRGFCRQRPHGEGPTVTRRDVGSDAPAIQAILNDLGIPWSTASCHWVGLDMRKLTPEQLKSLGGGRTWACERKGP